VTQGLRADWRPIVKLLKINGLDNDTGARARVAMSTLCRGGHACTTKNGFQAAIPETLGAQPESRSQAEPGLAKVRANPKNQPLQGLDTTGDPVEQKNCFCCKNHSYKLLPLKVTHRSP